MLDARLGDRTSGAAERSEIKLPPAPLKSLLMTEPPSHRLNIWTLADKTPAVQKKPAPGQVVPTRREAQERVPLHERLRRREPLFFDEFSGPKRASSVLDEAATHNIAYDHRLPIDIELPGRATMPNGRSTTCKTTRISSESVDLVYDLQTASYPLRSPEQIPAGSTVHLDLDQIGNFHGQLTSQNSEGFQLAIDVNCKGMLITKLAHVAAAIRNASFEEAPSAAKRSVTRIEPDVKSCTYTDHTGQVRKGKIINVSPYDALIKAPIIPPIATLIVFAGKAARVAEVTRTFEIGFAVQFSASIPEAEFSAAITFFDD
jgi:hypothetical protein